MVSNIEFLVYCAFCSGIVGDLEETFYNQKKQLVQWKFVDVPEVHCLRELIDGAEMYSRINEVDDADAYEDVINRKALSIRRRENILMNSI